MMHTLVLAYGLAVAGQVPVLRQLIRDVQLDPSARQDTVSVVGAPGITTTIRLPDSFKAENVSCAECLEVRAEMEDAAQNPRYWVIEKRVAEQVIFLRPHRLPNEHMPPHVFTTNVVVSMDGGYAVNIKLRLVDMPDEDAADAIVDVKLPYANTLVGRLAQERTQIYEGFTNKVEQQAMQLLLTRLAGEVRCRRVRWRRPYPKDRMVVRLNQLCASYGTQKTYWISFEAENRSAADLHIESATLEPETAVMTVDDAAPYDVPQEAVGFTQKVQGVALKTLERDAPVPSSWRLRVTPAAVDRESVVIDNLIF